MMQKRPTYNSYPWLPLRKAKIAAYEKLPDNIKDKFKNEMGVYDLDKVHYLLHIRWEKGIGWYPEVNVAVPKDLLTSKEG